MTTTQIVLQGKNTMSQSALYMSFELGDKKWQLTLSDGRRGPSWYTIDAGDTAAVVDCVSKSRVRCGLQRRGQGAFLLRPGRPRRLVAAPVAD